MKLLYLTTKEIIREFFFLLVICLNLLLALAYTGVVVDYVIDDTIFLDINSEYGSQAYMVDMNDSLYGQEGLTQEEIGYRYEIRIQSPLETENSSKTVGADVVNGTFLKIFDLPNKELFVERDKSNPVRQVMLMKSLRDYYNIGDIIYTEIGYWENRELLFHHDPLEVVGYLDDSLSLGFGMYPKDLNNVIYDHIGTITYEDVIADYYLLPNRDLEFYTDTYQPYELMISDSDINTERNTFINNKEVDKKYYTMEIIIMYLALILVIAVYSMIKADSYSRKFAVYNFYGEKKGTRFAIETFKICIVLLPIILVQLFTDILPCSSGGTSWWSVRSTLHLVMLVVSVVAYIGISMAVNAQLFFRKNLKKIGE